MADFSLALLRWFKANGRELPWRQTHDPYPIWLSEIILQQTRVQQGWDYWERFMRRWPTVEQLAAATEDEVLREWQGLGYYSRARNLHAAARQIVQMGGFPQSLEGIKSLKGVGDYTAAAIGSFAFGLPAAVVDGNVYRVLARHFGISTPINTTAAKHEFAALAQSLLPLPATPIPSPTNQIADYNQAIMDFGAILCTPSSPQCPTCPLQETCVAFREGRVGELPVKEKKLVVKTRHLVYIYIRCQGRFALHRRGEGDIWQGLWEPYVIERGERREERGEDFRGERREESGERILSTTMDEQNCSLSSLLSPLSSKILSTKVLKRNVKHVLTHRIIMADFYLLETDTPPQLPSDYIWIPEEERDNYAVPRLVELLFESLP